MNYLEEFQRWYSSPLLDKDTKSELESIVDDNEKKERFHRHLEFGTAGLRGVMGAGTNRLNVYTVRRATQGLADYIVSQGADLCARGVVIAHESRNNSPLFALETALTLAANGVTVFMFDDLCPVPKLSFAVRRLGCISGIAITASHNPKQYNGYKVYWEDGGQPAPAVSDKILHTINKVDTFGTKRISKDEAISRGLLRYIGAEIDDDYVSAVLTQKLGPGGDLSIVYSPLHGSGNLPVRRVLREAGFTNVTVVAEQELPDGDFPTAPYPNPEFEEPFALGVEYAKKNGAQIILATDPDADRVGVMVRCSDGSYKKLTGNQVGALLTEYVLSQKSSSNSMPLNPAVVSTIVSTRLTKTICDHYKVSYFDVYTGFKFIAEKILSFEQNSSHNFIMGWEESYGYLIGSHARDKDAVVACMMIAEMAQFFAKQNLTLLDAVENLYDKYGFHLDEVLNIVREGISGAAEIQNIMESLRSETPRSIGGLRVLAFRDYKARKRVVFADNSEHEIDLQSSNVLYFELEDNIELAVRPSGTEPKIKFYLFARSNDRQTAIDRINAVKAEIARIVDRVTDV